MWNVVSYASNRRVIPVSSPMDSRLKQRTGWLTWIGRGLRIVTAFVSWDSGPSSQRHQIRGPEIWLHPSASTHATWAQRANLGKPASEEAVGSWPDSHRSTPAAVDGVLNINESVNGKESFILRKPSPTILGPGLFTSWQLERGRWIVQSSWFLSLKSHKVYSTFA